MCSTDYDPSIIWEEWAPRARKEHTCPECGYTIKPGETYARCSGLSPDREWWGAIRCAACWFLCDLIETTECGGEGEILWGGNGLEEEVREFYPSEDDPEEGIEKHWARTFFEALESRP